MHTDSLLDFLHVYTSPALLFNLQGELLFENAAAELCTGGEISTEVQAQSAIFKQPQAALPTEVETSIYVKIQSEEFNFNYTTPAVGTSGGDPASRSSSSRPSSSSSARSRPGSSSGRPSSAKRRIRPTSRQNAQNGLSGSRDSTDSEWQDEDCSTPTGYTVERRQLHWKVTQTKCRRVVALAQEKATAKIPTLCAKDLLAQKDVTPVIRTPWERQPRFESIKKGGGTMGERVRAFDWDNHPLGPIGSWPQARVEMVGLVLRSPVPMTAYLEKEAYVIYNDSYIAVLGHTKHTSGGKFDFTRRSSFSTETAAI